MITQRSQVASYATQNTYNERSFNLDEVEEETVLTRLVTKEKAILHTAIERNNYWLFNNIVTHCSLDLIYEKDSSGRNTMEQVQKYGTKQMYNTLMKRLKKDLSHKLG